MFLVPHIMEMMGKARVAVKDGKVVEVGALDIELCPRFAKIRGIQEITSEEVKKNARAA